MKRFHFPLRALGVLREHQESRAREALAAAVRGYSEAGERLDEVRRRVAQLGAALFAGREGSFAATEEVYRLAGYKRETEVELAAERALTAAREALAQRRAEYLEAHRRLEVIRRLESKARTQHGQALGREEQAGFDEFASRRRDPVRL